MDSDEAGIHELSLKAFLCSEEDEDQIIEIFGKRFAFHFSRIAGFGHLFVQVYLQIVRTSDINCDESASFNSLPHLYYIHTMGS